jgi:hypothetical protein
LRRELAPVPADWRDLKIHYFTRGEADTASPLLLRGHK